jgi:hypothetical protein
MQDLKGWCMVEVKYKIMCGKGERRDVILKWGDRGRWRDTKGSQKCLK